MDTNSISEGTFLFMPKNFTLSKLKTSKSGKIFRKNEEKWNIAFNNIWNVMYKEIKEINDQLFKNVLSGLIKHIKALHSEIKLDEGVLPCEILLTGTNLPDHNLLVSTLTDIIKEVTPYFSVLWSRNCGTLKNVVINLVQQIVTSFSGYSNIDKDINTDNEMLEEEMDNNSVAELKFQVSQYNMSTLCAWYFVQSKNLKVQHSVVIFMPDFECFPKKILADFIHILSTYSVKVPFVLIFGVATMPGAIHHTLPHNVLSHLAIQLFKSEPSMSVLNHVIEKIIFSEKFPFRLGSNCMTFLMDIFLFHSFSVQGFIQGFKFCMMEHFYQKNHLTLCCSLENLEKEIEDLTDNELESLRRLPSFQKHVENSSKSERTLLLLNSEHTKKTIFQMMKDLQEYLNNFHVALKCLYILTQDLPQYPLGRHLREYYCAAISKDIRECGEFKESMRLLRFQSRQKFSEKISLILELLKLNSLLDILSSNKSTKFDLICSSLELFKKKFDEMNNDEYSKEDVVTTSNFETLQESLLEQIQNELFNKMLLPVTTLSLNEIILYDDLPAIRRRISGSPRGAIHLALNNPQYYLECKCCTLPHSEAVLPTLPDLSVVYKLHLEFGKIINLYDWLQAFAVCVKPERTSDEVDEEIQARFTRAVSELQFLGFIKPSRSKSDYVNRLTWGSL